MSTEISGIMNTIFIIFFIAITFMPFCSYSAELSLVHTSKQGSLIIEAKLDKVEKLAGMKLSIQYPKEDLLLQESEKSKSLNGFMHVVNDKIPGKVIAVVASATGISATNLHLFKFTFARRKDTSSKPLVLKPKVCELMNDSLKHIPCIIKPLTIR